jgi:sec-independent protein translocase protein TatA
MYALVPSQLPAPPELLLLLLVVILLFGADKIPKLARSSGKAVNEFREAKEQADDPKQAVEEKVEENSSTDNETAEDGGENQ